MVATGVAAVQKPRGLEAEAARHLSHIQRAICLPPVTTHVDTLSTTLDARQSKRASSVVEKRLQPESLTRIKSSTAVHCETMDASSVCF